jgi:hypothetical protein
MASPEEAAKIAARETGFQGGMHPKMHRNPAFSDLDRPQSSCRKFNKHLRRSGFSQCVRKAHNPVERSAGLTRRHFAPG